MALADPGQIISLSYLAADANSMIHTASASTHLNFGRLEELIALDADHFLASEYEDSKVLNRLRGFGKTVWQIKSERTLDQVRENVRTVAGILDQISRGERLVQKLNRIDQLDKVAGKPGTLLLGANYYISGRNTLASHIVEMMGYRNIADQANVTDYGRISMEQVVDLNPEVIILSKYSGDYSRAQSVFEHPALKYLGRKVTVIDVPTREWICGDQGLYDAARRLSRMAPRLQ